MKLYYEKNAEDILTKMNGIGKVTAQNILQWMSNDLIEYTLLTGLLEFTNSDLTEQATKEDKPLEGKVFVIAGTLRTYPNRRALVEEIEKRRKGGRKYIKKYRLPN